MKCRYCEAKVQHTFLDLGFAPPSNNYLSSDDLTKPELFLPLKVKVCGNCWLVQTEDYANPNELFNSEYAYFSSTSESWLRHAARYSERMISEFNLGSDSFVIEVASNDGYLLKNFVAQNIPCLGIEPTDSTADFAERQGIPVLREFFDENMGLQLASEGCQADLIVGNNVYAHVPDIKDFTRGLKAALKPNGTITLEFPHLMQLIGQVQFDTVYHEHFSYLSLYTAIRIFETAGLRVWNVEEVSTHGGSLRIFGCHSNDRRPTKAAVSDILKQEQAAGLLDLGTYINFQPRANLIKNELLMFLIRQRILEKTVVAYGAAAKGNTLLNYAGIKEDLLPVVFDVAKAKQGKWLPGSHIPIKSPDEIHKMKPDYVLVLPWNIATEVKQQLAKKVPYAQLIVVTPQLRAL